MSEAFIAGQIQNITQNISQCDTPYQRILFHYTFTSKAGSKTQSSPTWVAKNTIDTAEFGISEIRSLWIGRFGPSRTTSIGSISIDTSSNTLIYTNLPSAIGESTTYVINENGTVVMLDSRNIGWSGQIVITKYDGGYTIEPVDPAVVVNSNSSDYDYSYAYAYGIAVI